MHQVDASMVSSNGGAIAARVAEVFADQDRARSELLDRLVKQGGRCRYCSVTLNDEMLARHPEVCGKKICLRRARADGFVSELAQGAPAPQTAREKLVAAGFAVAKCEKDRPAPGEAASAGRVPSPAVSLRPPAEEERHAPAGGKAAQPSDPGPAAAASSAPPAPARLTTTNLIGELVARLDRDVNGRMPDDLPGGRQGSTARLLKPRLLPAVSAVMTDRACRCGCGRFLRKNNTTGWSSYCTRQRYAAGDRPARKSRAKEDPTMKKRDPCGECGSMSKHRKTCSKSSANGKQAAPTPPPPAPRTEVPLTHGHSAMRTSRCA